MKNTKFRTLLFTCVMVLLVALSGCGGGGGAATPPAGDTTPPTLALIYPAADEIGEGSFRDPSIYFEFSYSDASEMDYSSFSATIKISGNDVNVEEDMTDQFSKVSATRIKSIDQLYVFIRSLYVMAVLDEDHTILITASIKDSAGNTGTTSSTMTLKPISAPPGV